MGQPADFAKGDEIEQAIGPDPFKPIPFRMWMWDHVPVRFPLAGARPGQLRRPSRYAAMQVRGGPATSERPGESPGTEAGLGKRHRSRARRPKWG